MKSEILNEEKGFTLIEIIVVLIIVGVLAAIALPSYYTWIDRSHSAEALITLKTLADQMDGCLVAGKDGGTCGSQLLGATTSDGSMTFGGTGFLGFTGMANASPYFKYGIVYVTANVDNGLNTFYLILARWDISLNPRQNLSSHLINCPSNFLYAEDITPGYGMISLCGTTDPMVSPTRTISGSGVFQGMY